MVQLTVPTAIATGAGYVLAAALGHLVGDPSANVGTYVVSAGQLGALFGAFGGSVGHVYAEFMKVLLPVRD